MEEKVVNDIKFLKSELKCFKISSHFRQTPLKIEVRKKKGTVSLYFSKSVRRPNLRQNDEQFHDVGDYIQNITCGERDKAFKCDYLYIGIEAQAFTQLSFQFLFGKGWNLSYVIYIYRTIYQESWERCSRENS